MPTTCPTSASSALRSKRYGSITFGDPLLFEQLADTVVITACRQGVGVVVTKDVFGRVASRTDSDLFDEFQVVGLLDLCATALIVCQNGDRSDLQAE